MKKLDEIMTSIDKKIDQKFGPVSKKIKKYFTIISATALSALFAFFLIKTSKEGPNQLAAIIDNDLEQIEKVLTSIDKSCNILSFNYDNLRIDFLTVEKFVGSTIGCLNLAYPNKWEGPYAQRNPTLQGKFYEITKTKTGYFITPGQGVKLPNGQIVGKDFEINKNTDITGLLEPNGPLNFKDQKLASKIEFKIGDWDSVLTQTTTADKINSALKEFNEAMSFTKAETGTQNG